MKEIVSVDDFQYGITEKLQTLIIVGDRMFHRVSTVGQRFAETVMGLFGQAEAFCQFRNTFHWNSSLSKNC